MAASVLLFVGAYLLGSLPVLYWIGRTKGFDLRQEYDMHLALWRKVGFRAGVAGIVWDISKGAIPPLAAWSLDYGILTVALSGLGATAGQMWPIFFRLNKGEKGNSTGLGASVAISPPATGIALIPILIGAMVRFASSLRQPGKSARERFKFQGISDSVPLGMVTGFAVLPLAAWSLHQDPAIIWTFAGLFVLIAVRRLTADLGKDLDISPKPHLPSVLKNRLLYDRSYR